MIHYRTSIDSTIATSLSTGEATQVHIYCYSIGFPESIGVCRLFFGQKEAHVSQLGVGARLKAIASFQEIDAVKM